MSLRRHVQNRLASGLLVLIPLGISIFVLTLLYRLTVGVVSALIGRAFSDLHFAALTAVSAAIFVAVLYILGALAANVIGRRFIGAAEAMLERMPIIATVYSASKQVVVLFKAEPGAGKRTAVLVPFPHAGTRALGFLTGEVLLEGGRRMCTVFIPTTPNPTTGFLQLFPADDVEYLDMDVDDAFQFIMSAGILAPARFRETPEPLHNPGGINATP